MNQCSKIRRDNRERMFISGVNDTGDKLFGGVNDTADKFIGGVVDQCNLGKGEISASEE